MKRLIVADSMVEQPKSMSTQPRSQITLVTLYTQLNLSSTRSDRRQPPLVRQESVQGTGTNNNNHYVAHGGSNGAASSEAPTQARSSRQQQQRHGRPHSRSHKSTRFQLYNVSLISAASPGAMRAPPPVQKRKVRSYMTSAKCSAIITPIPLSTHFMHTAYW